MKHNMQSNIDHTIIQQLLTDSEKDGVQKLVVGAVIYQKQQILASWSEFHLTSWVDLLEFRVVP